MSDERKSNLKLEGEGSYEGAKTFQKAQHKFAKEGPVDERARAAADALDSDEAIELEKARAASAKGKTA